MVGDCSKEQFDFFCEFDNQHFKCSQHLRLQIKRGLQARQLSSLFVRMSAIVVGQRIGHVWSGHGSGRSREGAIRHRLQQVASQPWLNRS